MKLNITSWSDLVFFTILPAAVVLIGLPLLVWWLR